MNFLLLYLIVTLLSTRTQQQAARIHGNLAMAYKAKGKLQEAVNELHLQLKTELRIQDLSGGASTSLSLGNAYVSQGDYKNAAMYVSPPCPLRPLSVPPAHVLLFLRTGTTTEVWICATGTIMPAAHGHVPVFRRNC